MAANRLTVGVLGGMGPAATLDFCARLLAKTPAATDQEHLRVIVDNNPTLPNRHEAIARGDRTFGRQLADMARGLVRAGANFLVMPCNTAHAYAADIRNAVDVPFVDCIAETCNAVREQAPNAHRIGLLAAEGCLRAELYQRELARRGCEALLPGETELGEFMDLLYRIKAGARQAPVSTRMQRLAEQLAERGAEALIAGCTEVGLVIEAAEAPCLLVDSTDVLAARTVAYALGQTPLSAPEEAV